MNIDPALLRRLLDALIHSVHCVENNYYPARGTAEWNALIKETDELLKEKTNG